MQMIIISGLSGAGKSTAGEFLEDEGFYTIDRYARHPHAPFRRALPQRQRRL